MFAYVYHSGHKRNTYRYFKASKCSKALGGMSAQAKLELASPRVLLSVIALPEKEQSE